MGPFSRSKLSSRSRCVRDEPWNARRTLRAVSLMLGPVLLLPAVALPANGATSGTQQGESESEVRLREAVAATLRFGRHDDFDRITFEVSEQVDVDTLKSDGELVITFDRAVKGALPPDSAFTYRIDQLPQIVFRVRAEDRGRRYRIRIDPNTRYSVRRWSDGRLIVVDIARKADIDLPPVEAIETAPEQKDEPAVDDVDGDDDGGVDIDSDEESDDEVATAGGFEFVVGGSLQVGAATAGEDRLSDGEGDRGYAFFTDVEIDIDAYTTILEDVAVGASVSLEADADVEATANANSAYLYASNGFGTVELGRTSGAEDAMALGADTFAAGTGGIDGDSSNLGTTQIENSGDAAKVSYFTPRIAGFQFGASYTPDTGDEEADDDDGDDGDDDDLEDHVGLGFNFVGKFGDVETGLATVGSFGGSEFSKDDDLSAYAVGSTIDWRSVVLGLSYGHVEDDDDFDFGTLGLTLRIGEAAASLGYNYVDARSEGTTHIIVLSGDTPILPGVELQGDVSYADPEGDSGNVASVFAVEFGF